MRRYRHEAINLFGVEKSRYVAEHPDIVLETDDFSSGLFPARPFCLFARLSMPSEHTDPI